MYSKNRGENELFRKQHQVYFAEAPLWIIRGILFNAPHSIREYFKTEIKPLTLGGSGASDDIVYQLQPNGKKKLSKEELKNLKDFIQNIKSIPQPTHVTPESAASYVRAVVAFALDSLGDFKYFRDDLATITGNVSTRQVILEPLEQHSDEEEIEMGDDLDISSNPEQEQKDVELMARLKEQYENMKEAKLLDNSESTPLGDLGDEKLDKTFDTFEVPLDDPTFFSDEDKGAYEDEEQDEEKKVKTYTGGKSEGFFSSSDEEKQGETTKEKNSKPPESPVVAPGKKY